MTVDLGDKQIKVPCLVSEHVHEILLGADLFWRKIDVCGIWVTELLRLEDSAIRSMPTK